MSCPGLTNQTLYHARFRLLYVPERGDATLSDLDSMYTISTIKYTIRQLAFTILIEYPISNPTAFGMFLGIYGHIK